MVDNNVVRFQDFEKFGVIEVRIVDFVKKCDDIIVFFCDVVFVNIRVG